MKKRVFLKKKIGALTLALLVTPLAGVPTAQAGNIAIVGGGGGGGGGNAGGSDSVGTGGGGGGGVINATNPGANGSTGGGTSGGTGGTGGTVGGGVGTGGTASNIGGGSGGAAGGGPTSSSTGGNGGAAAANTSDMTAAAVGTGDTVNILGGNGGNGGAGNANGSHDDQWLGWNGGNGGDGGDASLNWTVSGTARDIASLNVKAGARGSDVTDWTSTTNTPYGSDGGRGGSATFFLDVALTTSGPVNVEADDNYATYESGSLTANGATTVTATNYLASMLVHGDADLTTLSVVSNGTGNASFKADGTGVVTTTGAVLVQSNSSGNATYESNNLTVDGATTVETKHNGSATMTAGNATMAVHGNADLQALTVQTTGTIDGGNASFTADGSGIVTTHGNVLVQSTGSGDATFNSVEYHGGGTTTISTTGAGDASMTVSVLGSGFVKSTNTMTINSSGSGNASFNAPLAGTVEIIGPNQHLEVKTSGSGGGHASFFAPAATVAVASGNLNVDSSLTTNTAGTSTFLSRGLNIAGATNVISGDAAASAMVTGNTQVTVHNLTVTAGDGDASFIASATDRLTANAIKVDGANGKAGDASIVAENAKIDTSNFNVTISTAGTNGGTKGIYAQSLETGNDQQSQANIGIVTMNGTGGGTAQLVLSDSLQTRQLNLTGAGTPGSVNTNINRVDVTFIDTAFNFVNTTGSTDSGASGVYFKTISLGAVDGTAVRTLTANAGLGTYWADTLAVNVHNDPSMSQNWVGNIWLGGHPGNPTTATGTVGTVDMILPAGANLTSYLGNGSGPNYMLKVDGQVTLADGATVNLRATQGNPFAGLKLNDQIQLVDSNQPVIDNTTQGVPVNGYSVSGVKEYLFNLQVADNGQDLLANFVWSQPTFAKAYLEGNIAALGNLYQGSELESRVVRNTFDPYVQGGLFEKGAKLGMMFGAEYADMRLDSGSHVDADYYNMVIGPAMRAETGIGRLGVAIFFETGHGDYSSYNSFPGLNVEGDGNTDYYGGGIALRNDFSGGIYADLSMRAGTVSTDQNLRNLPDARYDDDTTYVGGHVGLGKIFDFADRGRLDIYGGMLWTRLSGYSTTTDAAEHLDFDDANSLRSQLGGRYHYTFCKMATGYVGAAWEYEFDGDVGGTLDGVAIDEPSLQGSTGKGELGISITPADRLSIDFGVQGYTGEREGVGATAALTFTF
ncbi:hypothetical protein [Desulfobulbus sp.]|uniref:hypothetical protein n=1 Tax=Desulfobulbus sp. TaxID=895 RepID=UPI00286ECBC0|nr:hypothetical protein [Desulfobulbus sp.]